MKQKVEQNLYFVQKFLRLEKVDGQMYAIVKWENYSYKQTTRQSVESLKINPQLRADLERLEADYEISLQGKAIAQQTEQYTENYMKKLYKEDVCQIKEQQEDLQPNKKAHTRGLKQKEEQKQKPIQFKMKRSFKNKDDLTPHHLVNCNLQAKNRVKQRIKYGLANFRPKAYFELQQVLNDVGQKLQKDFKYELPKTDLVVQEVKGFYTEDNSYKFCLCVAGKVIVVPLSEMMELFPQNLFNYLTKFLRYAREVMSQQIKREEDLIASKRYKAKAIQTVSRMLNIRQHIQSNKKVVYFGRNMEDLEMNMKVHLQRFLGNNRDEQRKDMKTNAKNLNMKKEGQNQSQNLMEDLKLLHNQIQAQLNAYFRDAKSPDEQLRSVSGTSKRSQQNSVKNGKSRNSKDKLNKTEHCNQQYDSQSYQSFDAKSRSVKKPKTPKTEELPTPSQPRRSSRLSKTITDYSKFTQQNQSECSSQQLKGKKRKRSRSDKQAGSSKKIFKK